MNPYVDEQIEGKKVSDGHKTITKMVSHLVMLGLIILSGYGYYTTVLSSP